MPLLRVIFCTTLLLQPPIKSEVYLKGYNICLVCGKDKTFLLPVVRSTAKCRLACGAVCGTNSICNFADDNTLSAVGETIQGLVDIMQHKAESAISWMEENDMIGNPDKFKAIIITKDRQQTENYELNFKGKSIYSSAKVDLLGITIDNKLSFEFHIS